MPEPIQNHYAKNRQGCFIAVVGPSGAGKDTILGLIHQKLGHDESFVFIRRIVTRIAQDEDHETMSAKDFAAAKAKGEFALDWTAHGLCYALPASLMDDLKAGKTAIANISRKMVNQCQNIFGNVAVVEITARKDILRQRLLNRGRETIEAIEKRLDRIDVPYDFPSGIPRITIDNSSAPQYAVEEFMNFLSKNEISNQTISSDTHH